jgi:hypothetical protein
MTTTETGMGWVERSLVYPGTMFSIVLSMLQYMKQYEEYVRVDLVEAVEERVRWAQQRGDQPLMAFVTFWWLYTTWSDFVEMTHDVERLLNPLQSTPRDLLDMKNFAFHAMAQLRSSPFMPCNVVQLLSKFQRHMDLALHIRMTPVLYADPLDPVRVDKEPRVDALEFLPTHQHREMARKMRRYVHEYAKELGSRAALDGDAVAEPPAAIQVPMIDPLMHKNPIF